METTVYQGEIVPPHSDEQALAVEWNTETSGSQFPFDLGFAGEWEFIQPGKLVFGDPPKGAVRTWHVPPIHPEGEWLPELSELRHNPGGNGVTRRKLGNEWVIDGSAHLAEYRRLEGHQAFEHGRERKLEEYRLFRARFPLRGHRAYHWFHTFAGTGLRRVSATRAVPEVDLGWVVGLRRKFVSSGLIDPMDSSVLNRQVRTLRNRLTEYDARLRAGTIAEAAYRLQRSSTEALIEQMSAAWRRQFATAHPDAPLVTAQIEDDPDPQAPVAPAPRGKR